MHPGEEFARIEGLRDVVIGSEFQPHDTVNIFAARGEHDDRRRVLRRADPLQNREAVFTRHHQVENQRVKPLTHPEPVHCLAVFSHEDIEPVLTEIAPQEVPQPRVIIDHQNFRFAFSRHVCPLVIEFFL